MLHYGRLKALETFGQGKRCSYILFVLKPAWKFFNHFVLRLGFLDGRKGLVISYLNALGVFERCRSLRKLEHEN